MAIGVDAGLLLAIAALTDQGIAIFDRLKRVPFMSRDEIVALLGELGVDTNTLIDQVQADLEKLRAEVGGK
jgi:hypothetical protein